MPLNDRAAAVHSSSSGDASPETAVVLFVGEWAYPLLHQPVLSLGNGRYILPAALHGDADASTSWLLVVPPSRACEMDDVFRSHGVLRVHGHSSDVVDAGAGADGYAAVGAPVTSSSQSSLSAGIVGVGSLVATSITSTARVVGSGVKWGSSLLQSMVKPKAAPVVVDPRVKNIVSGVGAAAGSAMEVSGAVLAGVTAMATRVGKWVSAEVDKSELLGSKSTKPQSTTARVAKDVACSTIIAFSTCVCLFPAARWARLLVWLLGYLVTWLLGYLVLLMPW